MAMISCKDCGRKVSSQAKNCPECGAPVRGKSCLEISIRIILWFFVIGFFLTLMAWCTAGVGFLALINEMGKETPMENRGYVKETSVFFMDPDSSNHLINLDPGTQFTIIDTLDNWIEIEYGDGFSSIEGYLYESEVFLFDSTEYENWESEQ